MNLADEVLKILAPQARVAQGTDPQPWGAGHTFSTTASPREIKCVGVMGPNPRLQEDAAFDPPTEVLIQHTLGYFQAPEGHDVIAFPVRDDQGVATSNVPDAAWFTLEPGMTFDPNNPVCPKCGQPFVI